MRTTYRKFSPIWLSVVSAAAALTLGCSNAPPINYNVNDSDPSVKIPAIKIAAEGRAHDNATVRQLVKDLDSDDAAVRFYAIEGLRRITGEKFGYVYYEDEAERQPAVQKWRAWIGEPVGETPATEPTSQPANRDADPNRGDR